MLKTVRLEGGLYDCSLKSKLIELSYWCCLFSLKCSSIISVTGMSAKIKSVERGPNKVSAR